MLIVAVMSEHCSELSLRENLLQGVCRLTASSHGTFGIPVELTLRPCCPQHSRGTRARPDLPSGASSAPGLPSSLVEALLELHYDLLFLPRLLPFLSPLASTRPALLPEGSPHFNPPPAPFTLHRCSPSIFIAYLVLS